MSTPRNWNEPERAACVRRIDVGCAVGFATRTTRQLTGAAATNQCARRAMGASRRRRCRARPSALSPATLITQTDPTRPDPTSRRAPTGSWREATACLAGSAAQRPPPAQAENRPREFNERSQTIERPAALGERAAARAGCSLACLGIRIVWMAATSTQPPPVRGWAVVTVALCTAHASVVTVARRLSARTRTASRARPPPVPGPASSTGRSTLHACARRPAVAQPARDPPAGRRAHPTCAAIWG